MVDPATLAAMEQARFSSLVKKTIGQGGTDDFITPALDKGMAADAAVLYTRPGAAPVAGTADPGEADPDQADPAVASG